MVVEVEEEPVVQVMANPKGGDGGAGTSIGQVTPVTYAGGRRWWMFILLMEGFSGPGGGGKGKNLVSRPVMSISGTAGGGGGGRRL